MNEQPTLGKDKAALSSVPEPNEKPKPAQPPDRLLRIVGTVIALCSAGASVYAFVTAATPWGYANGVAVLLLGGFLGLKLGGFLRRRSG